jgi:hypothetical protein
MANVIGSHSEHVRFQIFSEETEVLDLWWVPKTQKSKLTFRREAHVMLYEADHTPKFPGMRCCKSRRSVKV